MEDTKEHDMAIFTSVRLSGAKTTIIQVFVEAGERKLVKIGTVKTLPANPFKPTSHTNAQ